MVTSQISLRIAVASSQLYKVKKIIRGSGSRIISAYYHTLNE